MAESFQTCFYFIFIIEYCENIFSSFFNKKVIYLISILKNDCFHLSFEVYNVCVLTYLAQKLQILEFLIKLFSPGPWPLRRPPETAISTSATSIWYQILAKDHLVMQKK